MVGAGELPGAEKFGRAGELGVLPQAEPGCDTCEHGELDITPVEISRKGADRLAGGHPWIFRSDVVSAGEAGAGELVHVLGPRGRFLGQAHYSTSSQIALRLLTRSVEPIDLGARIAAAQRFRDRIEGTTAYRLVHAEADFLPALIIDRYADCFTVQALNQGMDRALPEIVAALEAQFSPRAIVARHDAAVRSLEQLPRETRLLRGELEGPVAISMNGFRLEADLLKGQKTGVFLDQRENYTAVARYAHGRALDCFTSTGGFALHMAGKCESVEAVDSSATALMAARGNAERNGVGNIEFREADVFELLSAYASGRRSYDTIVLDPPAFAKSRGQVADAARGYKDINLRALRLLGPGGILVTCSCSHHMSEAALLEIVAEASLNAGRTLRVLERRTQASDHPILLTVPETLYLKCLILQVA
jgi:23S rRNA (cytosine1962-C5)-methyltransferase